MLYTPMTKTAMRLCFEAHKDQVDRAGLPYVFHPFHLAEQMETEEEICVALLHDVMEDTDFTVDDIRAAGMSDEVMEALLLLTHDPGVEYLDYVAAIRGNSLARKIKIADLKHNSDLSRLNEITDKDLERIDKYQQALELLGAKTLYYVHHNSNGEPSRLAKREDGLYYGYVGNQWVYMPELIKIEFDVTADFYEISEEEVCELIAQYEPIEADVIYWLGKRAWRIIQSRRDKPSTLEMADCDRLAAENALFKELETGRLSGEQDGWISSENVRAHFAKKASDAS